MSRHGNAVHTKCASTQHEASDVYYHSEFDTGSASSGFALDTAVLRQDIYTVEEEHARRPPNHLIAISLLLLVVSNLAGSQAR